MTGPANSDCVISERGGIVENTHRVHAAVVDPDGTLLYSVGDPSRITLIRSAAKPAQALAILETGCFEKYGFDDADLALVCASHSSEERHIKRAQAMLKTIGATEADLCCGGHHALSDAVNRAWIKNDFEPTAICNNCSGKHAGMIAGALTIRANKAGYELPDHPTQVRVKQVVHDLCLSQSTSWALDGCHLPAPAVPLRNAALLYARLANAAGHSDREEQVPNREVQLRRAFHAMSSHPEMVGGEGRFCTLLAEAFQGQLVGKLGADGCYGVAIRPSGEDSNARAMGIAVKIEDGNIDVLYEAVTEILEQLQIGSDDTRRKLSRFHQGKRLNTAGAVAGRVYSTFRLRQIADSQSISTTR